MGPLLSSLLLVLRVPPWVPCAHVLPAIDAKREGWSAWQHAIPATRNTHVSGVQLENFLLDTVLLPSSRSGVRPFLDRNVSDLGQT